VGNHTTGCGDIAHYLVGYFILSHGVLSNCIFLIARHCLEGHRACIRWEMLHLSGGR